MKKLLITLLGGKENIHRIRAIQSNLSISWLKLASSNSLLTRLHYIFISGVYDREAKAVISGQLSFQSNQAGDEITNYFLRRGIHRVEKGLIMNPRRDIFALDYIEDLVKAYSKSLESNVNRSELEWASDVLKEYFETVSDHTVIEKARSIFNQTELKKEISNERNIPYTASTLPESKITYDEMYILSRKRRSVRWYEQRAVPREKIDKALDIALQAPSACNRQPYRFIIFDDQTKIKNAAKLPMGVKGFEHNFPVLIILVGRLRAYSHSRDRHAIYVDGSLAAMSFMFALETLGLSSCPINWPDIKSREISATKMLNLDEDERIIMFISAGYPLDSGKIPFSQKIGLKEARTYNPEITINK